MSEPNTSAYGTIDMDLGARYLTMPEHEDGPIWMLNLMAYRAKAIYDGAEAEIDGKAADNIYNPIDVLTKIGADMPFLADVIDSDAQEGGWDRIAIVRYLTRRSFIEMSMRDDFRAKHKHKEAGMERTIVSACIPIADAPESLGNEGGEAGERFVMVHVFRLHDEAREETATVLADRARTAIAQGGSIDAMMAIEGTIIGDGRAWDGLLMVGYPSLEACRAACVADAALHADLIADRYDVMTRPVFDRMRASQSGDLQTAA